MTEMEPNHRMKKMIAPLIINFVVNYIMAFAVFLILANFGVSSIAQALITAAVLFVGFVVPLQTQGTIWNGRSSKSQWTTFLIAAGFQLINLAVWALLFIWLV